MSFIRRAVRFLPPRVRSELKVARLRLHMARDLRRSRCDRQSVVRELGTAANLNRILARADDIESALQRVRELKLRPHPDRPKNWDALRAFFFIVTQGSEESAILDAGAGFQSTVLGWLRCLGFRNLHACDLKIHRPFTVRSISYSHQDLHATSYTAESFDFIVCLSVIEHGVNIRKYFLEMSRLLKPGGYLLTSTDFWRDEIDTRGIFPYGDKLGEMKVFTPQDLQEIIAQARQSGFETTGQIEGECRDPVVHWPRMDRRYTFVFFALRKS